MKRSSRASDLKKRFKINEMSSISTLEVAWEHFPWGKEDQMKEEHFGALECRERSREFDGTNAYVYRHWRSDTDDWTNTCAPIKLFNINSLKGNVNYETDPGRHATGCNDPLKSARKACTGPLDVPEGNAGEPVRK